MARNSFFRFKQFTIWQDQTSMKVCTDACVLGAWTARTIAQPQPDSLRILDIGTGTGLLPLMIAQEVEKATFVAVEIDTDSAEQARKNVAESPYAERVRIEQTSIQSYTDQERFDWIVSNPPFFQNYLRSSKEGRNRAAHNDQLSLEDLAVAVHTQLRPDGTFVVLLPVYETGVLQQLLSGYGLVLVSQLELRNSADTSTFRCVSAFSRKTETPDFTPEILCIQNEKKEYTPEFVDLLKNYYLIF